nr:protein crossbronx homolog [Onthophagus taurus]
MLPATPGNSKDETQETSFSRQGSLRKVVLTQQVHKENLFGRQNEDLNKFYKSVHQEYIVLAEYQMLQSENLPGIYVIPSRKSCLNWFGVIFVRSGLYEDGVFRFNIVLPDTFPDGGHPKVVFQSEIIHPVIHNSTNELHLLDGFPIWDKREHHIWQVLKYIHWIFYNFNSSLAHAINKEAVILYKENQDEYTKKLKDLIKINEQHFYDLPETEDKHYLIFEPYDPQLHDTIREKFLLLPEDKKTKISGYSWVNRGGYNSLMRPNHLENVQDNS